MDDEPPLNRRIRFGQAATDRILAEHGEVAIGGRGQTRVFNGVLSTGGGGRLLYSDKSVGEPVVASSKATTVEIVLDPDTALQQLSQALKKARVKAGKPKLRALARTIDYSESMLSRVFNGRLVPTRDKLESLAEQLDVDTRTFNTVWLPLWEAAARRTTPVKSPAPAASEPVAALTVKPDADGCFTCAACKAWVRLVDAPGHIEWHTSLGKEQFRPASVTQLRPA